MSKNKIPHAPKKGSLQKREKATGTEAHKDGLPHINLKFVKTDFECFSQWDKKNLKGFSRLIEKLKKPLGIKS